MKGFLNISTKDEVLEDTMAHKNVDAFLDKQMIPYVEMNAHI
jgi:hypothetical protein